LSDAEHTSSDEEMAGHADPWLYGLCSSFTPRSFNDTVGELGLQGKCGLVLAVPSRFGIQERTLGMMKPQEWGTHPEMFLRWGFFFGLWLVDGAREGNSNWIILAVCLFLLLSSVLPFVDGLHKIGY
jgi:hypothetical protein